eukprot:3604560-Pyramimonas_sp.AAC.1
MFSAASAPFVRPLVYAGRGLGALATQVVDQQGHGGTPTVHVRGMSEQDSQSAYTHPLWNGACKGHLAAGHSTETRAS